MQVGKKGTKAQGFSEFEKAAMKERAKELLTDNGKGEEIVLAKIAEMPEADRVIAEKFHALVRKNAPGLLPKTWYGMPAYANKEGKVVCFFQSADKFKARYATIGFNDTARLDQGKMWPTSFAILKMTAKEEGEIGSLIRKATQR